MIMFNGEAVFPEGDGVPTNFSVGVGLGRIARFAGQTKHWYPVLCHVFVVADIMDPDIAIHGLLHDLPEVCCSDVPTPWKTTAAKKREKVLLKRVYQSIGLKLPDAITQQAIDHADAVALAAEANVLQHSARKEIWPDYDEKCAKLTRRYLKDCQKYIDPSQSGPAFMEAFDRYMEQHSKAALIAA